MAATGRAARPVFSTYAAAAAVLVLSACSSGGGDAQSGATPTKPASRTPAQTPAAAGAPLSSAVDHGFSYTVRIPAGWELGEDNGGEDKDVDLYSPCGEWIGAQGPLTSANGMEVKDLKDFTDKHVAELAERSRPAKVAVPPHTASVALDGSPTLEFTLDDKQIQYVTFRDGAGYVLFGGPAAGCTPDIEANLSAVASSWRWTS